MPASPWLYCLSQPLLHCVGSSHTEPRTNSEIKYLSEINGSVHSDYPLFDFQLRMNIILYQNIQPHLISLENKNIPGMLIWMSRVPSFVYFRGRRNATDNIKANIVRYDITRYAPHFLDIF